MDNPLHPSSVHRTPRGRTLPERSASNLHVQKLVSNVAELTVIWTKTGLHGWMGRTWLTGFLISGERLLYTLNRMSYVAPTPPEDPSNSACMMQCGVKAR